MDANARIQSTNRVSNRRVATLAMAIALLTPGLNVAEAASACLNDDEQKVCLALAAAPDDQLQPSGIGSSGDTFVVYAATVTNIDSQSSRYVDVDVQLGPGASVHSLTSDQNGICTVAGDRARCSYDKHLVSGPVQIGMEARVPDYAGEATPAEMVNTVRFGWNGRTSTVRSTIPIAPAGYSYVPPNTRVTLVTAEPTADPADQADAATPLFARMVVPPAPYPRLARLRIVGDGPDISDDCADGVFLEPGGDGGPYLCRDNANPRRWIEAALEGHYPGDPIEFGLIWDTSLVSPAQLPPTTVSPTGTPRFAVFYNAGGENSDTRAFAERCQEAGEPCLASVEAFSNGDWSATLLKATLEDPGQPEASGSGVPLVEVVMPDGGVGIQGFIPSTPPVVNVR